ncbi:hypothetical protein EYF80_057082 [Liparis tanakae]|uniref:Uncharacterized protein n=1 Tax=Liparis tanakae TaxID=230148 RepID=A0A4Z2EWX7_9TELE|nr:hypothetical protein EYF80_057082 [Liparis tanakae]
MRVPEGHSVSGQTRTHYLSRRLTRRSIPFHQAAPPGPRITAERRAPGGRRPSAARRPIRSDCIAQRLSRLHGDRGLILQDESRKCLPTAEGRGSRDAPVSSRYPPGILHCAAPDRLLLPGPRADGLSVLTTVGSALRPPAVPRSPPGWDAAAAAASRRLPRPVRGLRRPGTRTPRTMLTDFTVAARVGDRQNSSQPRRFGRKTRRSQRVKRESAAPGSRAPRAAAGSRGAAGGEGQPGSRSTPRGRGAAGQPGSRSTRGGNRGAAPRRWGEGQPGSRWWGEGAGEPLVGRGSRGAAGGEREPGSRSTPVGSGSLTVVLACPSACVVVDA